MRKASATIVYNGNTNQIYNMTIHNNGNHLTLVQYFQEDTAQPYKYQSLNDMYKSILNLAKQNNFYFSSFDQFGRRRYDVSWIDIYNPCLIEKFGYMEE